MPLQLRIGRGVRYSRCWPGCARHRLYYLKGGDLTEEIAESGLKTTVTNLSDFFSEEFYETKKVVFVPAK